MGESLQAAATCIGEAAIAPSKGQVYLWLSIGNTDGHTWVKYAGSRFP